MDGKHIYEPSLFEDGINRVVFWTKTAPILDSYRDANVEIIMCVKDSLNDQRSGLTTFKEILIKYI